MQRPDTANIDGIRGDPEQDVRAHARAALRKISDYLGDREDGWPPPVICQTAPRQAG